MRCVRVLRDVAVWGVWLLLPFWLAAQDYLRPVYDWKAPAVRLYDAQMYGAFYHTVPNAMPWAHAYLHDLRKTRSTFFLRYRKFPYAAAQLLSKYPEGAFRQKTLLDLAHFFFYHHEYDSAGRYLQMVDASDFSPEVLSSFLFMKGYTALHRGDSGQALGYFEQVAAGPNAYQPIAHLLAGDILFHQGQYARALPHFQVLTRDKKLGKVVPVFIVQTLWHLRRFDDLISYATEVLDENAARHEEVIRLLLVRALFFHGKQCNQALSYLEGLPQAYWTPFEYYISGVCALESDDPQKALASLQRAAFSEPRLRQVVEYLKGLIWARQERPARAHQAFALAYAIGADPQVTEHALYNAAIAAIRSGNSSEAFKLLKQFIDKYKYAPRRRQAIQLLSRLFMASRDYPQALGYLKDMLTSGRPFQDAYQQISYLYGRQLMEEGKPDAAVAHLQDAVRIGKSDIIRTKAYYLLGELAYEKKRFLDAIKQWRNFLYVRASKNIPYRDEAYYNLAYAELKGGTDVSASKYFRTYLQKRGLLQTIQRGEPAVHTPTDREVDAIVRLGDLYFKSRAWPEALRFYGYAGYLNHPQAPYAWLQIARIYGIQGDAARQTAALRKAYEKAPSQSQEAQEALLRLGEVYLTAGRFDSALHVFSTFTRQYPRSSLLPQVLEKQALTYYNMGKDDKALEIARRILRRFSGTEAAKGAANLAKNIYVERGRGAEYVRLIQKEAPSLAQGIAKDSILFESAFSWIRKNNCRKAIDDLEAYLKRFPTGAYAVKAHYYAATCALEEGDSTRALIHFHEIFKREPNRYSLKAVTWLARIYHSRGECDSVLRYGGILEAIATDPALRTEAQQMRLDCYYKKGNWPKVAQLAERLLDDNSLPPHRKHQFLYQRAEALLFMGDTAAAITALQHLAHNAHNQWGAQAAFLLANTYYQQRRLDSARQVIFDMPGRFPSYPETVAEGYLLLGKILLESGDTVQARYTYESLMKNAPTPLLKNIARKKYEEITP